MNTEDDISKVELLRRIQALEELVKEIQRKLPRESKMNGIPSGYEPYKGKRR